MCSKCNGSRGRPGQVQKHQCTRCGSDNLYWIGYGLEARDPDQPEWLTVERIVKEIALGRDVQTIIRMRMADIRDVVNGKVR